MERTDKFYERMMDIIEQDIIPQTERGVKMGSKVFGAAIVKKDNLELVVASTNHERFSPLWHGEVYAIKEFYEMQGHPEPSDCLMLATHQPCCMCASAIAWAGISEVWYLFGYEHTGSDFNIPHDQKMIRELFGSKEPNPDNSYYKMDSLMDLIPRLTQPENARIRFMDIQKQYAELSKIYQAGEKKMALT